MQVSICSLLSFSADVENITLFERFETFQANADPYNRFERFLVSIIFILYCSL